MMGHISQERRMLVSNQFHYSPYYFIIFDKKCRVLVFASFELFKTYSLRRRGGCLVSHQIYFNLHISSFLRSYPLVEWFWPNVPKRSDFLWLCVRRCTLQMLSHIHIGTRALRLEPETHWLLPTFLWWIVGSLARV